MHIKLLTCARPRGFEHVQVRIRNMYVRTYRYVTYVQVRNVQYVRWGMRSSGVPDVYIIIIIIIIYNWASGSPPSRTMGERERAHLVVQLGRAVRLYIYMYLCIYPVRVPDTDNF